MPLVPALVCALFEQTDPVLSEPRGAIETICGGKALQETCRCSFGINPDYSNLFDATNFRVAARDPDGAVRAMALEGHPFFIGTAFKPERAVLQGRRHPVIAGFIGAAAGWVSGSAINGRPMLVRSVLLA